MGINDPPLIEKLPDLAGQPYRVGRHKGSHQLQVAGVLQNHLSGHPDLQILVVEIVVVEGSRQLLVSGSMVHQVLHGPDGILCLPKAQGPEGCIDGHGIAGFKLAFTESPVVQAAAHKLQQLSVYPVHTVLVENADPGGYCPLHRGKTDQVMVLNHFQKLPESRGGSLIHGLADGLAQSFLETGSQKQAAQKLLKLLMVRPENPQNHLPVQISRVVLAEDQLL